MDYRIWEKDWLRVVDRCESEGYDSLTSDEKIWFTSRILIDAVENGGIISFYYNHGADYMEETLNNLLSIGANDVVGILNEINRLFPGNMPSKDIEERNHVIDEWDDTYEDLFDQLDAKFDIVIDELESKFEPLIRRIIA